jgi:hypothetical protein
MLNLFQHLAKIIKQAHPPNRGVKDDIKLSIYNVMLSVLVAYILNQ